MDAFRDEVETLVRDYIWANYDAFRKSELTFRTLKEHIVANTQYTYKDLKRDDRSEVIESTTDEIANKCDMGKVPLGKCKQLILPPEALRDEL